MEFGNETQAESAKRMYTERAANYENSWHPDYSQRFVALLNIQPGDKVLSLCCGTGLDAFLAAEAVGPSGQVIGVDITKSMLGEATKKKAADETVGPRCTFILGNVTDLDSVKGLEKGQYDWIICSSAFVLLEHSAQVVRGWKQYLRAGGRMGIDITHEHNLRIGTILEQATARLGLKFPSNRLWVKSRDSFKDILEGEGLVVEKCELVDKVTGKRTTYFNVDQADEQFDYVTSTALTANIASDEFKNKVRGVFREEFAKAAVDGKVEDVDAVYVYVARKP